MSSHEAAAASSKTYRAVNNELARIARVRFKHGASPREDFEIMTGLLDDSSKRRAVWYYGRGLRSGIIEACDALLDGRLIFKDGELFCRRKSFRISRRFRFKDGTTDRRTFKFKAEQLDFE
jgi:hypothetical protein